jgi:hypothetical protein
MPVNSRGSGYFWPDIVDHLCHCMLSVGRKHTAFICSLVALHDLEGNTTHSLHADGHWHTITPWKRHTCKLASFAACEVVTLSRLGGITLLLCLDPVSASSDARVMSHRLSWPSVLCLVRCMT